MTKESSKTERVHCNGCGQQTTHEVLASRKTSGSSPHDEHYDVSWSTIYDIFECRGCQEVTMRRRFYFSEWNWGDHEVVFYPPRISRRLPVWKGELPQDIAALLEEVYTALQADSRRLAMMGARALIDIVIVNEVGDIGSFAMKLKELEDKGFLSHKNRAVLEAALDVGNAASHRGYSPDKKHVQHVLDIVENLLQSTILHNVVDELKQATPKRKAKAKKTGP